MAGAAFFVVSRSRPRRVGEVFDDSDAEAGELCKAANSLAALANAYRGVTEAVELVARLEALEAAQGGRT